MSGDLRGALEEEAGFDGAEPVLADSSTGLRDVGHDSGWASPGRGWARGCPRLLDPADSFPRRERVAPGCRYSGLHFD